MEMRPTKDEIKRINLFVENGIQKFKKQKAKVEAKKEAEKNKML